MAAELVRSTEGAQDAVATNSPVFCAAKNDPKLKFKNKKSPKLNGFGDFFTQLF
ncbi:hypothetical protein [Treponema sp. UBA7567]|uniref:hypothetical protein n=1 Tax=Treponema sp. UBA7567 TaxID=1947748 RepID=UPI0025F96471|nr:hypothetical protein [Treponema sp. UBA7567]